MRKAVIATLIVLITVIVASAAYSLFLVPLWNIEDEGQQTPNPYLNYRVLSAEELSEPLLKSELSVDHQHVSTETTLNITIHNDLNATIVFGVEYHFQKFDDGVWKKFPSIPIVILLGLGRQPGENYTQTADIKGLITGRYRVEKSIHVNSFQGNSSLIQAEFTVQRPSSNEENGTIYGYYLRLMGISMPPRHSRFSRIEFYNQGGLTLKFTNEYHVYRIDGLPLVNVVGRTDNGTRIEITPGEFYSHNIEAELKPGYYRYVRPVYVEGYQHPFQYTLDFKVDEQGNHPLPSGR